jgi:hypothetical protein
MDISSYVESLQQALDYRFVRKSLFSLAVTDVVIGPIIGLFALPVLIKNPLAGALMLCFSLALLVHGVTALISPSKTGLIANGVLSILLGLGLLYLLSTPWWNPIAPRPVMAALDASCILVGLFSFGHFKALPRRVTKPTPAWQRHAEEVVRAVKQSNNAAFPTSITFDQMGLNPGRWKAVLYQEFAVLADARGHRTIVATRDQISVAERDRTVKRVRAGLVVRGIQTTIHVRPDVLDALLVWKSARPKPESLDDNFGELAALQPVG